MNLRHSNFSRNPRVIDAVVVDIVVVVVVVVVVVQKKL